MVRTTVSLAGNFFVKDVVKNKSILRHAGFPRDKSCSASARSVAKSDHHAHSPADGLRIDLFLTPSNLSKSPVILFSETVFFIKSIVHDKKSLPVFLNPFELLRYKLNIFLKFFRRQKLGVSLILLLIPTNMSDRTDERDPILCLENE